MIAKSFKSCSRGQPASSFSAERRLLRLGFVQYNVKSDRYKNVLWTFPFKLARNQFLFGRPETEKWKSHLSLNYFLSKHQTSKPAYSLSGLLCSRLTVILWLVKRSEHYFTLKIEGQKLPLYYKNVLTLLLYDTLKQFFHMICGTWFVPSTKTFCQILARKLKVAPKPLEWSPFFFKNLLKCFPYK